MRRDLTNEKLLAAMDSNDPIDVLRAVGRTLPSLRSEVRTARRSWRFTSVVVILAIALGGWLIYRTNSTATKAQNATDEIVAARASARVGLCSAIDDMRVKHNHFVNTAIAERQKLIDTTEASSTATPEQKAANRQFFEDQIANYGQDLVDIVDCNNPDSLSTLFTKPKPGG